MNEREWSLRLVTEVEEDEGEEEERERGLLSELESGARPSWSEFREDEEEEEANEERTREGEKRSELSGSRSTSAMTRKCYPKRMNGNKR